jgi:hypothetical protein
MQISKADESAARHTKEQLRASQRYADRRDIISALLEDGKTYTLAEVDRLIDSYLKGTVI